MNTVVTAEQVAGRLQGVKARIARVAAPGSEVKVVAVTKGFGEDVVASAIAAGVEDFGENYADELLAKASAARAQVRWHFLGALQRNKIARLAPTVYMWHSLDSEAAAGALSRRRPGAPVLVQVKVAGGAERRGAPAERVPELVRFARDAGLEVRGLMAVGPAGTSPGQVRSRFREVAALARSLRLGELSMGMSDDFELAVAEGATIVRLGRVLFGPRPRQAPATNGPLYAPEGSRATLGL
ncbi:MAG TPA: YggS family pyridoxal phosphate-dependent enzyme [Acidimicrobiales bacterium]|nr:YggS family pyridoxal phosphate-dependent enzyme [Acidimicrobiales bacterium]